MAKRGRRKVAGDRTGSGQLSRAAGAAVPSRAQAIRAASANPYFGSQAGRAFLEHRITETQLDQAKRVAAIVSAYRLAMQMRGVASPSMEQGRGGSAADPDSERGAQEARAHERAIARYDRMVERLDIRGAAVRDATLRFCIDEYCDWRALEWAKVGLDQLALDERPARRVTP